MKNLFTTITKSAFALLLMASLSGSTSAQQTKDAKKLIAEMQEAIGDWDKLYALNDVQFSYKYHYPGPDIQDFSTERYVFEGEKSWAKYSVHQINVSPKTEGEIIQYYDGEKSVVSHKGKAVSDPATTGLATFLRKANYFWFVMNFKLNDPGTVHNYEGTETVDGILYDKVSVAYKSDITGKPQNDAYIIYINPETKLVDRFFFSLPAQDVNEPILLMEVDYTSHHGLKLPTTRRIFMPDPKTGKLSDKPGLIQTSEDLRFDNGFTKEDLGI